MGRASAQRQPRRQPRPRLMTMRLVRKILLTEVGGGGRLAPGSPRGSRSGQGEEVGLVVCKPGGKAAGETGDGAACATAPAPAGAGRRQPVEPASAGEAR